MFDYILRKGLIIDGTGNPAYRADVAISDGKIVSIGSLDSAKAKTEIDCRQTTGLSHDDRDPAPELAVAPGFIDSHSHAERTALAGAAADSMLRQGVTTLIAGNCGKGPAPVNDRTRSYIRSKCVRGYVESGSGTLEPLEDRHVTWGSFGEWLDRLDQAKLANNLAHLAAHGTIRMSVMGSAQRAPQPDEMERMKECTREAMEAGALGLSSGLEFLPDRTATSEELTELVSVVAEYNGSYATHIRNRDQFFEACVEEALQVARVTGVSLELSHLNVKTGASKGAWFRVMDLVERARLFDGVEVTTDCIPYQWGPGVYVNILPDWFFADGIEAALTMLKDESVRRRLRSDSDRYWRFIYNGEWDRLVLLNSRAHTELVGKTFVEISDTMGKDPWDCYFDIILDEGTAMEGLVMYGRLFDEQHVVDKMTHPLFMFCSDHYAVSDQAPLSAASFNQAAFGWTAKILGHHVRDERIMRVEDAVRKMTSYPATKFGLKKRGLIQEGMIADITIFNPKTVADLTTLDQPHRYPAGIEYVFMGGQLVVDKREYNGMALGKVIRCRQ